MAVLLQFNDNTYERITHLHALFLDGKIPGPEKHEVNPGLPKDSRENFLYFTLAASLNFQRSSPALWQSALDTYDDPDTRYVFFPELVQKATYESLQADLLKHRLAVQTNKHPRAWQKISATFFEHYKSDPREFLKEGKDDVPTVLRLLQTSHKTFFPFLSGPKLSNYWLFILLEFTGVDLDRTSELSIIPDTHVKQSTIRLGLVNEKATPMEVEEVWRSILRDLKISPTEMHSALWRWSRSGFDQAV